MKTSCFARYQGPGRISVARYAPRATPPGFRIARQLAPLGDMLKMTDQEAYRDRYFGEVLRPLDPRETWDKLHALAGDAEPILLCWERLKDPRDWCHRRMIADWFAEHLGQVVLELEDHHAHQGVLRLDL